MRYVSASRARHGSDVLQPRQGRIRNGSNCLIPSQNEAGIVDTLLTLFDLRAPAVDLDCGDLILTIVRGNGRREQ